jgi:tetratricopeptide (TPR) repeat protein
MGKWVFRATAAAAALQFTGSAFGATQALWNDCSGQDLERKVKACTTIIQGKGETAKNRGIAYLNRGLAWRVKGDNDRAIADYGEAIALNRSDAKAYSNRGNAFRSKGEYDRAISDYGDAVRLDPKFADGFYNRAIALRSKGDYDRALADLDRAIELPPTAGAMQSASVTTLGLDRTRADYFAERSRIYRNKGDYDRAIADSNEVIRLDPNNPDRFADRGYLYFYKADFSAAAAALLQSIDLKDDSYPMLWRYLARARLGEKAAEELAANSARLKSRDWPYPVIDFFLGRRSVDEMISAATKPDQQCEAQFYLGEFHALGNNRDKAATALQAAVDACPKTYQEHWGAVAELKRLQ